MNAIIISVGTELITGQTVDTNSAWLAQTLIRGGVEVVRHVTVGDDRTRLATSIRHAFLTAELVVVTGGLGPTEDDVTRGAIAEALDVPLEEHPEALHWIISFFERWGRPMSGSNRVQAQIPRGGRPLPNARGTAPGIACDVGDRLLAALPGVPSEMKAMFTQEVLPLLASRTRGTPCAELAVLHCFGMGEAKIGEMIADLMDRDRNPLVGTTAGEAIIGIRIISTGASREIAESLLADDVKEIRRRLGNAIFGAGDDTLATSVAELLTRRNRTLATAESCTGGLLGKMLTDVPGSSAYYLQGFVTYADRAKTELLGVPVALLEGDGAVSEAVARAMAEGARRRTSADFALSITGIAGPTGGTPEKPVGLVYIGLSRTRSTTEAAESETVIRRLLLGSHLTRAEVRDRACKSALNTLRLHLLGDES